MTTAMRSHEYANSETLWRTVVRTAPESPRAYVNLGAALLREVPPKKDEAEVAFRQAMALDTTCHFGCAPLAKILAGRGQTVDAEQLFERTLAFDPGNAPVERRYALLLMRSGAFDRALPHLRRVAASFPTVEHLVVLSAAEEAVGLQRTGMMTLEYASRLYPGNGTINRLIAALGANGSDAGAPEAMRQLALKLAAGWE